MQEVRRRRRYRDQPGAARPGWRCAELGNFPGHGRGDLIMASAYLPAFQTLRDFHPRQLRTARARTARTATA